MSLRAFCFDPSYESSNDGNTAWRFFENLNISATITGVSEYLINRFYVILQAISSDFNIKCDKFREYALEIARKFIDLQIHIHISRDTVCRKLP